MQQKLNVSTILPVESDRLISVSESPKTSLFIILLSRTISLTYFERNLTFWTRIVMVSFEITLLFNVGNNTSLFTFIAIFQIPLMGAVWPAPNDLCFRKPKSTTPCTIKPWTLLTADIHAIYFQRYFSHHRAT